MDLRERETVGKKHFGNLKMRFVFYSRAIIYESVRSQEFGPADSIVGVLGGQGSIGQLIFLIYLGNWC